MYPLVYNEACAMQYLDPAGDVAAAAAAGFDGIELRFDCLQAELARHGSLRRVATALRRTGLRPYALNALYIYPEYGRETADTPGRAQLEERLTLLPRLQDKLGCRECIVVAPLCATSTAAAPYRQEAVAADCARILQDLCRRLPTYAWIFEPVGLRRSLVRDVPAAAAILRRLPRGLPAGLVLDACNLYLTHESCDYDFSAAPPGAVRLVHLMDGVAPDGPGEIVDQSWRRLCGDGNLIDIPRFLRALRALDYHGPISTEVFWPGYARELTAAAIIARAARGLRAALAADDGPTSGSSNLTAAARP